MLSTPIKRLTAWCPGFGEHHESGPSQNGVADAFEYYGEGYVKGEVVVFVSQADR